MMFNTNLRNSPIPRLHFVRSTSFPYDLHCVDVSFTQRVTIENPLLSAIAAHRSSDIILIDMDTMNRQGIGPVLYFLLFGDLPEGICVLVSKSTYIRPSCNRCHQHYLGKIIPTSSRILLKKPHGLPAGVSLCQYYCEMLRSAMETTVSKGRVYIMTLEDITFKKTSWGFENGKNDRCDVPGGVPIMNMPRLVLVKSAATISNFGLLSMSLDCGSEDKDHSEDLVYIKVCKWLLRIRAIPKDMEKFRNAIRSLCRVNVHANSDVVIAQLFKQKYVDICKSCKRLNYIKPTEEDESDSLEYYYNHSKEQLSIDEVVLEKTKQWIQNKQSIFPKNIPQLKNHIESFKVNVEVDPRIIIDRLLSSGCLTEVSKGYFDTELVFNFEILPEIITDAEIHLNIGSTKSIQPLENFDDIGDNGLLRGIYSFGIEYPTKIQSIAIPTILTGKSLLLHSLDSSGKTYAWIVAVLKLMSNIDSLGYSSLDEEILCKILIIAPTRLLANHIYCLLQEIGIYLNFQVVLCVGGSSIISSRTSLSKKTDIVIGTNGRLQDLYERNILLLDNLRAVVVDSISSFKKPISLLRKVPEIAQFIYTGKYVPDNLDLNSIGVIKPEYDFSNLNHYVIHSTTGSDRNDILKSLLSMRGYSSTLVFCNTTRYLDISTPQTKIVDKNTPPEEFSNTVEELGNSIRNLICTTDINGIGTNADRIIILDTPHNANQYFLWATRGRASPKPVSVISICGNIEELGGMLEGYGLKLNDYHWRDGLI
eukprot:TRINITY_DN8567_c1_g2_i1.p1 TRINITY_DN8567_c1_g2~~TRINITY_DN8567_c1_g2_i1.p1  ORF type:complete len:761 (-),score=114.39 TRINITY_DN8567_c1_g2_i1:1099-3381(-)